MNRTFAPSLLLLVLGCEPSLPKPEDTAPPSCDEAEAQPGPTTVDIVLPPCGGQGNAGKVWPISSPRFFAAPESGACASVSPEPGVVHVFAADTMEVVRTISWPEYIDYGGDFEFGPGPSGDATDGVFALLRSDEIIYSNVEFYDVTTWDRLGALESNTFLGNLTFAGEEFLVARPYERFAAGAVYLFSPPWQEDMETDDRIATHRHPDACDDCRFGQILQTLGDVTGDGLDDAVMGGGGFWFVDGELLRLDEGVSSGVAVSAGAAGLDDLITNVGDFDGDGIDDYATANLGAVALLRGGEPDPFARYHNPEDPELRIGNISDAIGPLGDIDGDGWPTIAAMAFEDSRLWLVEGPLRCGDYDIVDVGTLIESRADGYDSGPVPAGSGLLVTSSTDLIDTDDRFWRVMRWE